MKHVIVGTAGHIDHGKTALVKALTGIDCDRWEEEKRRGITIDIGFAHLQLPAAPGSSEEEIHLGFIDVPGHERFVKNMLAGVSGIDLVMLVIAADESIMPQTREHFEIGRLLHIPRGLTVITKCDLVDEATLARVQSDVRAYLKNSFLEDAPMLAVSSVTGAGLEELKTALCTIAADVHEKDSSNFFRLPIDRAFSMKGFGTVITGTLVSGAVARDDEVELFPARKILRVRGLQVHGKSVEKALAGQRTALNLQNIEVGELARGMSLAAPGRFEPTQRFDAEILLLESSEITLKRHARVHLHHGTMEQVALVHLLDRDALPPGETALAQIFLTRPALLLPGDRFILRRFSPVITIGGGRVLHLAPERHSAQRDVGTLQFLNALRNAQPVERVWLTIQRYGEKGLDEKALIARLGLQPSLLRNAVNELKQQGKMMQAGSAFLTREQFDQLLARSVELIEEHHTRAPLAAGMPREELKRRLSSAMSDALFHSLLEELRRSQKILVAGDVISRAGRKIELKSDEEISKQKILEAFQKAGLSVPSVEEVLAQLNIEKSRARQLMQLLLREKLLVRLADGLVFHADALQALRAQLAARKASNPKLTVADFKTLTGVSRKYAIPLLEYLDRERVTRRQGDVRIIL